MDLKGTRRLRAAVRSALRGLRATPLIFLASAGTLAAGLSLLGAYRLVLVNMGSVLDRAGEDLKLVLFLPKGAEPGERERDRLVRDIEGWPEVDHVGYVSAEAALERLRIALGSEGSLVEDLHSNPLPSSLEIHPVADRRSAAGVRALAEKLARIPGVDDVRYGVEWVEGYTRVLRAIEWVGLLLGLFLVLVLGAIVAGTVRLALHAREDELRIQRLVGAGTLFVRLPFYVEGALQGLAAAGAAIALLYALYALGLPMLGEPIRFLVGGTELRFLAGSDLALLGAVGVGLGVGGAAVSLFSMDPGT